MKKLAIAILLLAASVASSQAASNWSGCYAGGNIGYSLGRAKTDTTFPNPTTTYSSANNLIGAVGGGQIGCNWLTSPAWLAGLEADIQWSGEDGSFQSNNPFFLVVTPGVTNFVGTNTVDATSKITWLGTARGRFGYLWNDMLMFATGGLAYGEVKLSGTATTAGSFCTPTPVCGAPLSQSVAIGGSNVNVGWTVGGGFEAVLPFPSWTWKVEYLYVDLGKLNATNAVGLVTSTKFTDNIVRLGLNYHFVTY